MHSNELKILTIYYFDIMMNSDIVLNGTIKT